MWEYVAGAAIVFIVWQLLNRGTGNRQDGEAGPEEVKTPYEPQDIRY